MAAEGRGGLLPVERVGPDDQNRLVGELYAELRTLAGKLMRDQRHDALLQTTVLVHDACLKLFGRERLEGVDRVELLALAAVAMRNLLVDRARTRNRLKRCSNGERVPFEQIAIAYEDRAVDLLALDDALVKLKEFDPEMSRAVELRFFAGLSMEETATFVAMPLRTLERRWETTRAWLRMEVG